MDQSDSPQLDARIASIATRFDEQDADLAGTDPLHFEGYPEQVAGARGHEACVWGWATIDGVDCALVVMDFGFLGGSMGVAVGEKVADAFDSARKRKFPVVTVTASGGARMQEGMVALVQMAKTSEARRLHAEAGLAQVSVLTSPTTGGVYASFASLADVVIASPDATIGFAGPRVVEELTGATPDPRIHKAEFAYEHGLVDAIVPVAEQPAAIATILRSLAPATGERVERAAVDAVDDREQLSAWQRLDMARDPARPKAGALLDALFARSFQLRGDRSGEPDDPAVVVRVGELATGATIVAIAEDSSGPGRIEPEGYRKVVRAVRLAGRLGLPVVTLIDTRGADPLPVSEGHGIAAAIASTFVELLGCPSPTLSVITGEGGSGGALAMAVCDRIIAWENAVFSVIAPEAAASILYRDASRGPELAERLGITAADLVRLKIVDDVVAEPPGGAHTDPARAADSLAARIAAEVGDLTAVSKRTRLRRRHRRWRGAGNAYIEHIRP
jgi:acetyl-CoA carboxylase carboxyl transferase subunit beta